MTRTHPLDDDAYETLARLCEGDPDAHIDTLQELGTDVATIATQESIFKALAHADRIRILEALRECECCVCELQVVIDAPQSTVATHLRTLRDAGLIRSRKKGKWSYYRIADTAALEVLDLAGSMQGAE